MNMFAVAKQAISTSANGVMTYVLEDRRICDDDVMMAFDKAQDHHDGGFEYCYVPFHNGLYDLCSGKFRAAHPEESLMYTTGYEYDTSDWLDEARVQARHQVFDYLISLCGGEMPDDGTPAEGRMILEKELRMRFLQYKLLVWSSSFRPKNTFTELYFCLGSGGNGKSFEFDFLQRVFGNSSGSSADGLARIMAKSLAEAKGEVKAGAPNPDLCWLMQSRLTVVNEPKAKNELALERLNEFTGRDRITVRQLYGKTFEMLPKFTIYFNLNRRCRLKMTGSHAVVRTGNRW